MADFEVRPAVSDDALAIIALLRDLEPDNDLLFYGVDPARTDADQRQLIETLPDNSLLLVAEAGGQIVGYLECRGGTFPAVRHSARIVVMVRRDWRNRGIGTALMQHIIDWADTNPIIHKLESEIPTSNHSASYLYRKLGFAVEGEKEKAYFKYHSYQNTLLMRMITDGSETSFMREITRHSTYSDKEIVAIWANEFKTPLITIQGYSDLLLNNIVGELNPRQKEFIGIIRKNAYRLADYINQALSLVRLQDGYYPTTQAVNFDAIAQRTLKTLQTFIEQRQQTILFNKASNLPFVLADDYALERVLVPILKNAIQYTPEGSTIELKTQLTYKETDRSMLLVSVQDRGRGISEAELQQVFQPFFKGQDDSVREQAGLGLGLTIARGMVERMGGEMWIESEVGVGTTVHFTLPTA